MNPLLVLLYSFGSVLLVVIGATACVGVVLSGLYLLSSNERRVWLRWMQRLLGLVAVMAGPVIVVLSIYPMARLIEMGQS